MMNRTQVCRPTLLWPLLLVALVVSWGAAAIAQTVYVVDTQPQFSNLSSVITDGDKVVLRGLATGTFHGTINIVGVQDVTLVAAREPTVVGVGTVGNGGFAFANGAVPIIDGGTGTCITVNSSQRIRIVGLRLKCGIGVHIDNADDVQVLGNELRAGDGGVRSEDAGRAVIASNRIEPVDSSIHAFGVEVIGGHDNLIFDNYVRDVLDIGIRVAATASRTATINNQVESTSGSVVPFSPSIGIWDFGQQSCLLRNTVDAQDRPFEIGCGAAALIGNRANPLGMSTSCNVSIPPSFPTVNDL